jgi:hypothetical protein
MARAGGKDRGLFQCAGSAVWWIRWTGPCHVFPEPMSAYRRTKNFASTLPPLADRNTRKNGKKSL